MVTPPLAMEDRKVDSGSSPPFPYPVHFAVRKRAIEAKMVTAFQFRVYDALLKIPKGKVTTYKELAIYLKSHPRAVGQAVGKNPFAPYVPCHRVIASTGELGSYTTKKGVCPNAPKKKKLLADEGIEFCNDKGLYKLDKETFRNVLHTSPFF